MTTTATPRSFALGLVAFGAVAGGGSAVPVVPKTAVQTVGDHVVVYIGDPNTPGRFFERPIRVGAEAAGRIAVDSGVAAASQVDGLVSVLP